MASRLPIPAPKQGLRPAFAARRRLGADLAYTHVTLDPEGRSFLCAISRPVEPGEVIRGDDGRAYRLSLLGSEG